MAKTDMDTVAEIRARYDEAVSWDDATGQSKIIQESLRFCDKENQWPEDIRAKRRRKKRPCLTIDRTNPFVRQVVNQLRQNKVEIKVDPVDSKADPETARVLQGIIRSIMRNSRADLAIDTACESSVRGGIGYVRVTTEYADDTSFDQCIKLMPIPDPLKVKIDPTYVMPDGSDISWAMIEHDFTPEQVKAMWPGAEDQHMSSAEWGGMGDTMPGWVSKDGNLIRVVEYFEKAKKTKKLYKMPDGSSVFGDDLPEGYDTKGLESRDVAEPYVKIVKCTAAGVLERGEWAGRYIPIVPMFGDCLIYEGKRIYTGLVWAIMDIAKSYNVMHTAEIETIALVPKAPVMMGAEAVEGYEKIWQTASTEDHGYLPYHSVTTDGRPIAPPIPLQREAPIQAISASKMGLGNELKNVSGMFDPTLGNRSETGQSGVAIARLQRAGEISQYQYQDNRSRMMRQLGAILIDAIPVYYDTPRIERILGLDDKPEMVGINQEVMDPQTGAIMRINAPGVGKYDVVASDGPSFQTQREQDMELAMELMRTMPQIVAPGAHLIMKMMNSPFADELAKIVHPEEGEQQIPPQVQQQIQQGQQLIQQLQQEVQRLQQGADVKLQTAQMDAQIKAQQSQLDMQVEAQKAQMDAELTIQKAQIDAQTKIETAKIQSQTDIYIAQMRGQMELQGQVASTAVTNAMQNNSGDVEIELGDGNNEEEQYNGGAGMNAGMEEE